jgi:hypothetical protein
MSLSVFLSSRSALAADGLKVEAVPFEGSPVALEDAWLSSGWTLIGKRNGQEAKYAGRDLVALRFGGKLAADRAKGPYILLPTGEILRGEPLAMEGDDLKLKSSVAGDVRIPMSVVKAIVFASETSEDKIRPLFSGEQVKETDLVLLKNGDVVRASLLGMDGEKVKVRRGDQETELARDLVVAVALDPALIDYKPSADFFGSMQWSDGSRLSAKLLESEGAKLKATTPFGREFSFDAGELIDVSFRNGRVVYLSDLEPTQETAEPFADDKSPSRRDRTVLGTPLRLHGKVFSKGLGVRSYSVLKYGVAGFARFEATVGLDDVAGKQGSVRFTVLLDDQVAFDSGEMPANAEPKTVALPLKGVKELTLTVDYAKRGDVEDFADWADARLVR